MRRHIETILDRAPDAGRRARRLVARFCASRRVKALAPDAETLATELVENTLQHTESVPRLRLELRRGLLTVAVSDDDPAEAYLREGTDGRPSLGMLLVTQIARTWGCTPSRAGGKTVWASLRETHGTGLP
jgi:hypothetical protein